MGVPANTPPPTTTQELYSTPFKTSAPIRPSGEAHVLAFANLNSWAQLWRSFAK